MHNRSRIVLFLSFVFFLTMSGTVLSQEFYKGKATPSLEKVRQTCNTEGEYLGKYKDSSGVLHFLFYKASETPIELTLYQLDTDVWVASGSCRCAGCSRVITK
jgi:hypothetical protein